jgi:hypothetical protein
MPARPLRFFTQTSAILAHGQYLLQLQQAWQQALPMALRDTARVGAFDGRTMTIYAKNGAVAAKLKQQQPSLLKKLQGRNIPVSALHIAVKVEAPPPAPNTGPPRAVTPAGQAQLAALADRLPASKLKKAVENMLAHQAARPRGEPQDNGK